MKATQQPERTLTYEEYLAEYGRKEQKPETPEDFAERLAKETIEAFREALK